MPGSWTIGVNSICKTEAVECAQLEIDSYTMPTLCGGRRRLQGCWIAEVDSMFLAADCITHADIKMHAAFVYKQCSLYFAIDTEEVTPEADHATYISRQLLPCLQEGRLLLNASL